MTQGHRALPRAGRIALVGCCLTIAAAVAEEIALPAGAAGPTLTIAPGGALHDGESISVSVGPNSVFTPHSHVNILECADPGGTAAHLPTDESTCDGNSIESNTILVGADGSFSETSYTIYALPSSTLGEQSNDQPVCNATNDCVLYIGQDQGDFTAPKIFSAPFAVAPGTVPANSTTATTAPGAGTSGASQSTPGTTASNSSPSAAGASSATGTISSGSLASTGVPNQIPWTVAIGTFFVVIGSIGRRLAPRFAR